MTALAACHDGSSPADAGGSAPEAAALAEDDAAPEAAAPIDAEADASLSDMIDRAIKLLEDVGAIAQANMNDCDAMADRVETYRLAHLADIKRVDLIYQTRYAEEFEQLKHVFSKRYYAAWAKIRPGINKCRRHEKMRHVLMQIWGDEPADGGLGSLGSLGSP